MSDHEAGGDDLTLKLTDFGFAVYYNPKDGLTQVLGSPLYMAPEIVMNRSYNMKVDIWSIGVIAHILLTGCPPFFGAKKEDIYNSIKRDEPRFGRVKDRLSAEAIEFTLLCLEKNPQDRASADELLAHPWIQGLVELPEVDPEVENQITQDLAAFRKQTVF